MDKYTDILERQLCIDYDCTLDEIKSEKNIFKSYKRNPYSRPIGLNSMLKIAVYNEKLLVMADERLLDWCKLAFNTRKGTWLSEPKRLISINHKLQEFGQILSDTHHHYLPCESFPKQEKRYLLKWYEKNEIEVFRGDRRFFEALAFDKETPDMLAVCAIEGTNILGMASATYNCEKLWEIGVNVTTEGRNKGIGTYVTTALKDELLERGIVPTYATVESHIKSQKVAFKSGFEPTFYELFSE